MSFLREGGAIYTRRKTTAQRVDRPKRRAAARPSIIETSDREDAQESSEAEDEVASGAESEEERTPEQPYAAAAHAARYIRNGSPCGLWTSSIQGTTLSAAPVSG